MPMIMLRDGATVRVQDEGEGVNLVLISGLGGTLGFWDALVEALGDGLRTVRYDQRGIGKSERGSVSVTVRTLAEDTWEIIDALDVERPVLGGHSTGGAIVQEMELLRPGVASGLVLSGSWAGPDPFMQRMFGLRLDLLKEMPERYAEFAALLGSPPRWHRDFPQSLEAATAHTPSGRDIEIIRERIEALLAHDCTRRLSGVDTSTLVLGSEDDMIVPVYLQEALGSLLSAAQLHIFDHGGHFFPVTRPRDTANVLREWLETLKPTIAEGST